MASELLSPPVSPRCSWDRETVISASRRLARSSSCMMATVYGVSAPAAFLISGMEKKSGSRW
eukprot:scaffold12691_cov108-Isochrysis_galbana.AAC.14